MITKCPNCHIKLKNNIRKSWIMTVGGFNNLSKQQIINYDNFRVLTDKELYDKLIKNKTLTLQDFPFVYTGVFCWACRDCGMIISFDRKEIVYQKWAGLKS